MAKDFSEFMPNLNPVEDIIKKSKEVKTAKAEPTVKEIKKASGEKSTHAEKNRSQLKLESKKTVKDKRINLVLTEQQYKDLITRAEAQGLSYGAYIRQLIAKDISEVNK